MDLVVPVSVDFQRSSNSIHTCEAVDAGVEDACEIGIVAALYRGIQYTIT